MTTPPSVLSMSTTSSRSLFLPSPHPFRRPHPRKTPFSSLTPHASSSHHHQSDSPDDKDRTTTSPLNDDLLRLTPATLTVLSTSLAAAAPAFAAKSPAAKDDKRKRPSSSKRPPPQALSPEELQQWTRDLPDVSDRIPYTDLLRLREEGLLKHIVKPRSLNTKHRPSDAVLAILRDSRVLRAVLPPAERDPWFWDSWDSLRMDDLCMNAYTPALKSLFPSPYLGFISKLPYSFIFSLDFFLSSLLDLFLKYQWWKPKPLSKRELEFERLKARMEAAREAEMERIRTEREIVERALEAERRMEERRRREEARTMRMERFQEDLEQAKFKSKVMRGLWTTLAKDTAVSTTVAWMIFGLFYWVVVYNYRRSKKDYEDRMKIQQVEREDRKKMRELLMEEQEEWNRGGGEEGDDQQDYLKMAQNFMRSGARVRRARGKRLPKYMDMQNDVRFSDCAGLGKIRYELEEVVKFFTHGEVYQRRGIKTPGGILLCGPPGVGKTLLAKAVAGEAGVNFLSISASQFVEIYVGVGASRVRALYEEAKQNAPSVVFIDELDAVGRTRGLIEGSGGQERDATLNQLLVCLDGFEGRGDVVTIAATNRPDILDPALVRPGRFDRKIVIPRPGFIGRLEILKVHAQNKPIAEDIDYDEIASKTEGMVGAELANVVEMAAIRMMRDGRSEIITDDILQAIQVEDRGLLEKKVRNLDMWKRIALLEGSLAVAAVNFPELNSVEFITISPRSGRELGYARLKRDRMKFWTGMLSRQYLLDYITVQLAPRAADAIWYGEDTLSTIWAQAADNARSAARSFVFRGLSEKYYGLSQFWSVDRHDEIDLEAMRILDACYARAREILQRNRVLLDAVVDRLVEKKSLTKQEFFHLVNEYGQLEALPPSLVDIRREKLAEFREMTMSQKSQ